MKRMLLFMCLMCVLLFTSCIKKEVVAPAQTIITTINTSDWQYSSSSKTYLVSLNMPEINDYVNNNYAILVYFTSGNNVYEALPEVYNGYSYSFTHEPGLLTIEVQGANGTTVQPPNYSIKVKIVLIPSG